jgi:glycine cleavage system H protein
MSNQMNESLQLRIDKFTFRFPKGLKYSEAGFWIRQEENGLRLGLSDFIQQRSGDIAFANLAPPGTELKAGDELASIETVKVNISLPSPVTGTILEINADVQNAPELINFEPYTKGWMVLVRAEDLEGQVSKLLSAETYAALAKEQAETDLNS